MIAVFILSHLGMMCAVLYPGFVKTSPPLRVAFKSAAAALFVAAAIVLTVLYPGHYAYMILAALVAGAFGDVFLVLHALYPKKGNILNIIGGLFFLGGHVVYVVLFMGLATFNLWLLIVPVVFVAMPFVFAKKIDGTSLGKKGKFLMAAYAAVLGMFLVSALNLLLDAPGMFSALVFVAAIMFSASDTMLMFGFIASKEKVKTALGYAVAVAYFGAQWIFVYSIMLHGNMIL